MSTTTLPSCIDALVNLFTLACPGTQVFDGQPLTNDPLTEFVAVAIALGDAPSVDGWDQGWAGLGARRRFEGYSIHCQVGTWGGAGPMKGFRDRAFVLLGACIAAVDADPTLGFPPPFVCEIRPRVLIDAQSPKGPVCQVEFAAVVDPNTSRISGA